MFTVKHVEGNGHEALREAKTVWREPFPSDGSMRSGNPRGVFVDVGDEHPLLFCSGTLYIMNTAGKTVGVYYLDPMPEANAPS